MRFIVVCLALLAATVTSRAEGSGPDGFSICAFGGSAAGPLKATIGPCQALTGEAMERFGLSASQLAIVASLQRFAISGFDPPQGATIAKSLAASMPFAAVGPYSDYWFPDVADPRNAELGVHMRYRVEDARPQLSQMTYAVDGRDGHFTVLWNRILMAPR
jgi:hypothetical protein